MLAITYGNDQFTAVGGGGVIGISPDGINWTKTNNYNELDVSKAITYGNGKFVVVGATSSYSYITTSTDGKMWTAPIKYTNNSFSSWPIKWQSIIFSKNTFATIGSTYDAGSFITTSLDGTTWTDPIQIKDESGNRITADTKGIVAMP